MLRLLLASLFMFRIAAAQSAGPWRIVDGDIAVPFSSTDSPPPREAAFGAKLWPSGRIPYEIAPAFRSRDCLMQAIREWNTRTPIRLTPRLAETDYLVFRPSPRSFTAVGLIGGAQPVFLEEGVCELGIYRSMVHEIGHSAGMFHEHQRSDRDRFVRVNQEFSNLSPQDLVATIGSPQGPYDFASVMHYGPLGGGAGAVIETIPRGIPTALDLGTNPMLSAGDLDALERMYAEPPRLTTISTNPPGLDVLVDGQRRVAPFTVDWAPGTQHSLDVPWPQTREGARYEFGRWNDEGRQTHTITAGVLSHFAANFIAYVRIRGVASDPERGTVAVDSPDGSAGPADGLRLIGTLARARAQAAPGFFLRAWELGRGSRNPLVFPVFSSDPVYNEFVARFEPYPVTTMKSEPPGLRVVVNGVSAVTPAEYRFEPGSAQTIDFVREVILPGARHRLEVIRTEAPLQAQGRIIATPIDASIAAIYRTDYPVRVAVSPPEAGRVALAPNPSDGYLPPGERLSILATPAAGFRFLRWRGAAESDANPLAVTVQGAVDLIAEFTSTTVPANSLSVRDAASALMGPVAPGKIVSVFINGLPELAFGSFADERLATEVSGVRVLVNGVAAPIVAVAPGQVNAIVPYGVASEATARFSVIRDDRVLGESTVTVAASAPALFTANASGSGQAAALNRDGSFNSAAAPALARQIVVLFGTGEGALEPSVTDGSIAVAPLSKPRLPISVEIGGKEARVVYAGPAPGSVHGLLQINAEVPAGLDPGSVPVIVRAGSVRSVPGVTIAVE